MLTLASELQMAQHGPTAAPMERASRERTIGFERLVRANVESTTITPGELLVLEALEVLIGRFLEDLRSLHAQLPRWALAYASRAARQADLIFREQLANHRLSGGGPIVPDAA